MSEANDVRGEISLDLGGTEYVLRPTHEAILAIERKAGKGLIALARDCAGGLLSLPDLSLIIAECVKAQGRAKDDAMMAAVQPDRLAELILDSDGGITAAAGRTSLLLMLAATGGYTSQGELKAAKNKGSAATA